jgi:hypothetical protein
MTGPAVRGRPMTGPAVRGPAMTGPAMRDRAMSSGVRSSLARMATALAVFAHRAPGTAGTGTAIVVRDDGKGNVSVALARIGRR